MGSFSDEPFLTIKGRIFGCWYILPKVMCEAAALVGDIREFASGPQLARCRSEQGAHVQSRQVAWLMLRLGGT